MGSLVGVKCEKNEKCSGCLTRQIMFENLPCTRLCARIWDDGDARERHRWGCAEKVPWAVLERMSKAVHTLVCNVILDKGFVGGAWRRPYQEKQYQQQWHGPAKVENEIKLCSGHEKYFFAGGDVGEGEGRDTGDTSWSWEGTQGQTEEALLVSHTQELVPNL